ncbi:DUF4834 family protein [Mangrovibacterium lignilyticum]|uniref:DUF4834 family protein n=1 Tax=Mangrovibacterium lignilyticum TaxID=2668052 RepID=UPI0013D600C4|nr:DUF4834 family protein [Mangrovibacterium lignilyticum]
MVTLNVILFLVGFLRTLFIVVVFYYLFRFLIKLFAPLFGFQAVNKQPGQKSRKEERREGEVRVENPRNQQSNISRDEGEYVDFEEID